MPTHRDDTLASARRVLKIEAKCLTSMADSLDDAFVQAVDMLLAAKGHGQKRACC